jgi:hypothetical protein
MGFTKPTTLPVKTRARGCGCGFPRIGVQVSLENPRVARDTPYPYNPAAIDLQCLSLDVCLLVVSSLSLSYLSS